jgi:hypothetical protein
MKRYQAILRQKKIEESSEPSAEQTNEEFQVAEITVPGMLGWLTGQRHRPINGDPLSIYVNFDHDCLVGQPNHTICFQIFYKIISPEKSKMEVSL